MPNTQKLLQVDFEERARVLGKAVFEAIDVSFKRSEAAPRSIVVEIASVTPKSGKTTQCQKLSSSLRAAMGSGLSVQVVPEPWEDPAIRALRKGEPDILLERYKSEILANYLDYLHSSRFHVAVLDRSIVDLFIQEEFFTRQGIISRAHRDHVWDSLLSTQWLKNIDATFYLFTDIPTALAREKQGVSLDRIGSVMNPERLQIFIDAASATIAELKERAPYLAVSSLDTTHASEGETNAQITLLLLERLRKRLNIDPQKTIPYSLSLMRTEAEENGKLQVQLKLKGHPQQKAITQQGWALTEEVAQKDVYGVFLNGVHPQLQPGEIIRIREVNGQYSFAYKGVGVENTVTRRPHINIPIEEQRAQELMTLYSRLATVTKRPRRLYERAVEPAISLSGTMYLCVDTVEELGEFTELSMYAHEYTSARRLLLEEAQQLEFCLADIVEGNYLKMATTEKK